MVFLEWYTHVCPIAIDPTTGILIKLLGDIFVEAGKFREQGATCEASSSQFALSAHLAHAHMPEFWR
eukprot:4960411-Amphidinium_carterae.2